MDFRLILDCFAWDSPGSASPRQVAGPGGSGAPSKATRKSKRCMVCWILSSDADCTQKHKLLRRIVSSGWFISDNHNASFKRNGPIRRRFRTLGCQSATSTFDRDLSGVPWTSPPRQGKTLSATSTFDWTPGMEPWTARLQRQVWWATSSSGLLLARFVGPPTPPHHQERVQLIVPVSE